jgi:AcrR family transcriptional regulator
MVQLAHDDTNTERINKIIEVAQRLFGTFGLEKTTMKDIARNLGMSKAPLYYYFPDKESIYKAVVEQETEIFLDVLHKKMDTTEDPAELIRLYTEIRLDYFRNLMNISRIRIGA